MTGILTKMLGRLPIGWLQLLHNRMRLLAALAGVAFANILIFMQLGFLGALSVSTKLPYQLFDADVLIYSPDTNTLGDAGTVPRQRMFQALSTPGTGSASLVYIGTLEWERDDGGTSSLRVFGVDPDALPLTGGDIARMRDRLRLEDVALLDSKTRGVPQALMESIARGKSHAFEAAGRTITIEGLFTVGAGFDADGYLIVSDQTFLRLFSSRISGAPNYIFVKTKPNVSPAALVVRLQAQLPGIDSVVRTREQAATADQSYQLTERPIGVVFGFGVAIGIMVGIIIVYQVLSTDVADHLSEYATFKAIGYRQTFFLSIVFEEAIILALLGFVPGIAISIGLYAGASIATGLPIEMDATRPFLVLIGTILMCVISGAIATRRLAAADPAELF
ncbi:MAG: ABC transporter permease DevC [Pseudomonadota bacterium]